MESPNDGHLLIIVLSHVGNNRATVKVTSQWSNKWHLLKSNIETNKTYHILEQNIECNICDHLRHTGDDISAEFALGIIRVFYTCCLALFFNSDKNIALFICCLTVLFVA